MNGTTVLIIGAGHIGEACAIRALQEHPSKLILHTLTKGEAEHARKMVLKEKSAKKVAIHISWGDILVPTWWAQKSGNDICINKKSKKEILDFLYGEDAELQAKKSFMYALLKKYKPDVVIDAVNTATVVGYTGNVYELPRNIIKGKQKKTHVVERLMLNNPIVSLVRFTQALQCGIEDFGIKSYVKVSTTGIGGMGVNLKYTHGDVHEKGMSTGILGKVAAAGIMHQLFWSLAHTPGLNIKVIAPAALVGWQPVSQGSFKSHGEKCRCIKGVSTISVKDKLPIFIPKAQYSKEYIQMPFVDSGENSAYSLHEMSAITTLGQMESITREEVADATVMAALGSTKNDLLTTMDYAAMGPSFVGATRRNFVLDELRELEKTSDFPSIATNNLGPKVSKHLFELYILMQAGGDSLHSVVSMDTKSITKWMSSNITSNSKIAQLALSLGLPILHNSGELFIHSKCLIPVDKKDVSFTKKNIDTWAEDGWIDLRVKRIEFWKMWIGEVLKSYKKESTEQYINIHGGWEHNSSDRIGDLLGRIYSLQGGQRKKGGIM